MLTVWLLIVLLLDAPFSVFLPAISHPRAFLGPGVAGGLAEESLHELGATWDYSWDECHGARDCLPMWRVGCAWYPLGLTVDGLMHSCGPAPCLGLMVLNEPGWQDVCSANCQAEQLHEIAPQALAANPQAEIVFGNYTWPDTTVLDDLAIAWAARYPGEDLGRFLRDHHVRIGVHHYAWPDYEMDVWRGRLLQFKADVAARWAVPVLLSEYGALDSGLRWKQVVGDQALWLMDQGIMAAPWVAAYARPEDVGWGCCPMRDADGLTEYGRLYAGLIVRWDR